MRLAFFTVLLMVTVVLAQQPTAQQTGVLRLRVRVKADDAAPLKGLARKRFFLIRGTLEQNRALVTTIEQQPLTTRDCYYKQHHASAQLISWLQEGDCESVYCRSIENEFVTGPKAVPEFANAFAANHTEFGNDVIALQWLTNYLSPDLRDGFYKDRQRLLQTLLNQTGMIQSVMTDQKGSAYFTDLGPGTYVISNVIPTELAQTLVTWNCEVQIKPEDLATEKPYLISNRKDKTVKCVGIEKPKPICPAD
jgi:hypothetical protein